MKITLNRNIQIGDATIGGLVTDTGFHCYTLEDIGRETKVHGETRIPAGTYQVRFRKVVSGKTSRYRQKYPWFTWHLELQDVPGYEYVYIHVGNRAADTEGCILVGRTWDGKSPFIGASGDTYTAFYKEVSKALESGEKVTIVVQDEEGA
uniref:L,D-carboxypeptidase/transpeptidase n=1 Tax=Pseudomonas phage Cygsa01 TaxID=3138529 RepID=A0AAU6W3V2_9VIRU